MSRRHLLALLALVLAVGPVGSYAHGLRHLFAGTPFPGHEEAARQGDGSVLNHGKRDGPGESGHGPSDCELLAPMRP